METTEETSLVAGNDSRKVKIYLFILALFLFPHAAAQIAIYDLLYDVVCARYDISGQSCLNEPKATKAVADLLSASSLVNGILATVIMAGVASLSDRSGRKFGLMWNFVFTTLGIAAFPLLAYGVSPHVTHWKMLVPYILTALSGSPSLVLNLSVLFITDCLPDPKARTRYLSIMLGIFMFIQAIAPGIGSAWLKAGVGIGKYFLSCALGMTVCSLLFSVAVPGKQGVSLAGAQAHLKESLGNAVDTVSFKSCESSSQRRNAWILLINFFFSNEFAIGFLDLLVVYAKHKFGWEVSQIGQTMFGLFSIRCAWALIGFPITYAQLSKVWSPKAQDVDWPDMFHMIASSILTLFGYIIIGFAKTSPQYTTGIITLANDGLAGPVWVNALLKHVAENKRGEFLAALGLFIKPVGAFLPAVLLKIFQATINSNAVFLVVIAMATAATISLGFLRVAS